MKLAIIILSILAATVAVPFQLQLSLWNNFKVTHNKVYDSLREEQLRFEIFSNNLHKIEEHNRRYDEGVETYYLGVNKFTDMTEEEFADYLALSGPNPFHKNLGDIYVPPKDIVLPESIDYRDKNAVNPVKDQKSCGSCWAFSATATLESIYFLQKGKLYSLSEQNLVDCSDSYGNAGCNGGNMEGSYNYIIDHGIETEEDYPYSASTNQCLFDPSKSVMKISGHTEIESGNEEALQAAIAEVGPIAVGVDGTKWQMYKGGIFNTTGRYQLNHGVVAIGFGVEDGKEYYIVRNSWGPIWGEKGYIRVARNAGNQVGISDLGCFPVL